jgi:hypothetical protein
VGGYGLGALCEDDVRCPVPGVDQDQHPGESRTGRGFGLRQWPVRRQR